MNNPVMQELEKITIPREIHERTKLGVKKAQAERPKGRAKWLAIPLIATVCVVLSAGAAAARVPSLYNLIAYVSPETALLLQPVELRSEDDGIAMEVIAAMNDNEMAVVYVAVQDLNGDRVDETIDLYDYSISGATMFNSRVVDYDETTKTAILRIQGNGGKELNNRGVHFRITSFLSDKRTYEFPVDIDLSEISSRSPQTVLLDMNTLRGGGGRLYQTLEDRGVIQILKPNGNEITFPEVDFVHIANIGVIGNYLHIQVKWQDEHVDDHGYFDLLGDHGNEVLSASFSFGTDDSGRITHGKAYTEYVFDIASIDLNQSGLSGYFVTNGNYVTGNWSTTFRLEPVSDEIKYDLNKDMGTWALHEVTLSPLGVTLHGKGRFDVEEALEVSATMTDGSVQALDSRFVYNDDDGITIKFVAALPLELSKISVIHVSDTPIHLNG